MNFSKSLSMMPILVGLSVGYVDAKTELLFSESQLMEDNNMLQAKASILAQHQLNITSENFIRVKFDEYYYKWLKNSSFISNPNYIIEDENFQNIIKMGATAVPLIINKISEKPSQLVWALNIITQIKLSQSPTTSISDACKLWIKWARQNNI